MAEFRMAEFRMDEFKWLNSEWLNSEWLNSECQNSWEFSHSEFTIFLNSLNSENMHVHINVFGFKKWKVREFRAISMTVLPGTLSIWKIDELKNIPEPW